MNGRGQVLEEKVAELETSASDATRTTKELVNSVSFATSEIESLKKSVKNLKETIIEKEESMENRLKEDIRVLRDEKLYMEVYQRRENLRFHGIEEDSDSGDENTKEVLVGFMKKELEIEEADTFEFHRIHRIGKKDPSRDKPRQIIARFLRYSNRERVMNAAKKLKGKNFGISADLPKEIVDRRKKLMPECKQAKKDGKNAFFSRSEPDKLFVEGFRIR